MEGKKLINFCTLFDINYLPRGLLLYKSLLKNCSNFTLYIFAFDDITFNFLKKKKLKKVIVIHYNDFEDIKLKKIKNTRSRKEYFWTCTGSTILYLFKKLNLPSCTYLDADLFFFKNPKKILDKLKNASSIITNHHYTPKYNQEKTSGKYCVQFMFFKNNYFGNRVLNSWRNKCLKWCYDRFENNKFGDQKYLDNWKIDFSGVYETKMLGAGIAPWNIQQYKLKKNFKFQLLKNPNINFVMYFYHFHGIKFLSPNKAFIGYYKLSEEVINFIYKPYLLELKKIQNDLLTYNVCKKVKFFTNFFLGGIFIVQMLKRLYFCKNFIKI